MNRFIMSLATACWPPSPMATISFLNSLDTKESFRVVCALFDGSPSSTKVMAELSWKGGFSKRITEHFSSLRNAEIVGFDACKKCGDKP